MWEPQLRGKPASTKIKIYFFFILSSFSWSEEKQQWYLFKSLSWSANKSGLLFRCWCELYLLSQCLWSCCHGRINQTSVVSNPNFVYFFASFSFFYRTYVSCFLPFVSSSFAYSSFLKLPSYSRLCSLLLQNKSIVKDYFGYKHNILATDIYNKLRVLKKNWEIPLILLILNVLYSKRYSV